VIRAVCLGVVLVVAGCAAPGPVKSSIGPTASPALVRVPPPARIIDLLGRSPDQLLAVFGAPILRRHDGDAEAWLYAGGPDCKLDLVFYRDGDRQKLTLAQTRAKPEAETACLRQIAALPAK
jgi:hypothetical protein